jgi:cytidylate kinase
MASGKSDLIENAGTTEQESPETPRHGFRGNQPRVGHRPVPASLTIAVSREAGSRGSTIGARAGAKLGWPVYNQELLEYLAQENAAREGDDLGMAPEASRWVADQMERLIREERISDQLSVQGLARVVLGLATQGAVVLIGRGAGLLLPRESTLHVRVVAPLADRIAYMSQWLRLTVEEASEQIRQRDARRAEFLSMHFHHTNDIHQYDMVLNSSLLGEELCAGLIADAARTKSRALLGERTLE